MNRHRRQFDFQALVAVLIWLTGLQIFAQNLPQSTNHQPFEQIQQESGLVNFQENGLDRSVDRTDNLSLSIGGSDIGYGQITAGQLWEYFHRQGRTSVDHLKFDLNCQPGFENELTNFGMFRFQIEGTDGGMLSSFNLNANDGYLDVPLDYDYMKRFSRDSQEIIRFELPSDGPFSLSNTQILVASDAPAMGSRNLMYLLAFCGFWILVFILLNRMTKPFDESAEEIRILSNPLQEQGDRTVAIETLSGGGETPEISPTRSPVLTSQTNIEESDNSVVHSGSSRKTVNQTPGFAAGSYVSTP